MGVDGNVIRLMGLISAVVLHVLLELVMIPLAECAACENETPGLLSVHELASHLCAERPACWVGCKVYRNEDSLCRNGYPDRDSKDCWKSRQSGDDSDNDRCKVCS